MARRTVFVASSRRLAAYRRLYSFSAFLGIADDGREVADEPQRRLMNTFRLQGNDADEWRPSIILLLYKIIDDRQYRL